MILHALNAYYVFELLANWKTQVILHSLIGISTTILTIRNGAFTQNMNSGRK